MRKEDFKEKRILEVACNRGTTAIELAQRFGCKITAVDMDAQALEVAKKSAETAGVGHLIRFERANAMKLPYEDASFDIVINEAMLTMQADQAKKKCVMEYLRVLKPEGLLLTHDVLLKEAKESVQTGIITSNSCKCRSFNSRWLGTGDDRNQG